MSIFVCLVYKILKLSYLVSGMGACQTQRSREELSGSRALVTQQLQLLIKFFHPPLTSTLLGQLMGAYLDMLGREREKI